MPEAGSSSLHSIIEWQSYKHLQKTARCAVTLKIALSHSLPLQGFIVILRISMRRISTAS